MVRYEKLEVSADVDRLLTVMIREPQDELLRSAVADMAEETGLWGPETREALRLPGGWFRTYRASDL